MEKEQKRLHSFDALFLDLAARVLCREEQDPARREETARAKLQKIAKNAKYLVGGAAAGLAMGGAQAFGGISPFGCALLCSYDYFLPVTALARRNRRDSSQGCNSARSLCDDSAVPADHAHVDRL